MQPDTSVSQETQETRASDANSDWKMSQTSFVDKLMLPVENTRQCWSKFLKWNKLT